MSLPGIREWESGVNIMSSDFDVSHVVKTYVHRMSRTVHRRGRRRRLVVVRRRGGGVSALIRVTIPVEARLADFKPDRSIHWRDVTLATTGSQ